VVKVVGVGK